MAQRNHSNHKPKPPKRGDACLRDCVSTRYRDSQTRRKGAPVHKQVLYRIMNNYVLKIGLELAQYPTHLVPVRRSGGRYALLAEPSDQL